MTVITTAASVLAEVRALLPRLRQRLSGLTPSYPVEELETLAACGVLAAPLEGRSSPRDLLQLLHLLGQANLVLGRVIEGHFNALLLIERFGTALQKRQAASDVLQNDCLFGVWNTGPPEQPQLLPISGGGYEMQGGKTFATGVKRLQRAIVTASLGPGHWQMCVLDLSRLALSVDEQSWQPFGMEASESFAVDFSGVTLAEKDLLGDANDYYAEPFFTAGAMRFSAVQLGAAEALLHFTRSYLCQAGREHDPLQQARLGRMAVAVESGRQWLRQAAAWLASGNDPRLMARAHLMRVAAEEICGSVIQLVQTSVGARGLLAPSPIPRMLRDLQMYLRQAGSDQALLSVGKAVADGELDGTLDSLA